MNFKHKRMLIWDLKELDDVSHQSLTVEPFNMWPSGNCGHVYSASHTQARRHISGWAMRNTNNHNINILKKSCLGVLVCNRCCRKSDGNVVAVRPAICDKARKKQIGRKCPNTCGGMLVMKQCKGHSGYPVTHFWRHHLDKVFFLGKGYHDHPKPELKLSSEKRKTYIRAPNKKVTGTISNHTRLRLANTGHIRLTSNNTCKHPGLQATKVGLSQHYQHQSTNIYHHQLNPPPYHPYAMQAVQDSTIGQRLIVPDCDVYIPAISQEHIPKQIQPVYAGIPEMSYKIPYDPPGYYQFSMNSASFPVDYSLSSESIAPASYTKQIESSTRSSHHHTDSTTSAILDLSLPTNTVPQLDNTWHSDPPEPTSSSSRYYTKNFAHFQTSMLTMSSQVLETPAQENLRPSTSAENTFEQRRDETPFRLKNLWDCIYPAEDSYASGSPVIPQQSTTESPSVTPVTSPSAAIKLENVKSEVSLKEMMDIDDLDMGDISNILSIPAGGTKIKQHSFEDRSAIQPGPLPNLSSFLRGIEYL